MKRILPSDSEYSYNEEASSKEDMKHISFHIKYEFPVKVKNKDNIISNKRINVKGYGFKKDDTFIFTSEFISVKGYGYHYGNSFALN